MLKETVILKYIQAILHYGLMIGLSHCILIVQFILTVLLLIFTYKFYEYVLSFIRSTLINRHPY